MKTYLGHLTVLMSVLVLSACGFVREAPEPIRLYVLESAGGDRGEESPIFSDMEFLPTLLIGVPQAAPGFESSRMVYMQVPHELNYFATSQWVASPARMLTPLLVERLEHSRRWSAVIPMPTSIRGDYRLNLSHVVLVQEFLQPSSRLRLAWRSQLVNMKNRHVIGTRNFEREEEVLSEDAYGGVLAAQQALTGLLNDVNEWVVGCLLERTSGHC